MPAGVHRVRVEADGGLTKTIEVNVVAGKEIAQLVELTKGPDRAADRAAAAAASAAAAPAPPTPGFMIVDAPEDLQIVEDGRVLGSSAVGQGRARPRQPPDRDPQRQPRLPGHAHRAGAAGQDRPRVDCRSRKGT